MLGVRLSGVDSKLNMSHLNIVKTGFTQFNKKIWNEKANIAEINSLEYITKRRTL